MSESIIRYNVTPEQDEFDSLARRAFRAKYMKTEPYLPSPEFSRLEFTSEERQFFDQMDAIVVRAYESIKDIGAIDASAYQRTGQGVGRGLADGLDVPTENLRKTRKALLPRLTTSDKINALILRDLPSIPTYKE